jgi:hypothetical protein
MDGVKIRRSSNNGHLNTHRICKREEKEKGRKLKQMKIFIHIKNFGKFQLLGREIPQKDA